MATESASQQPVVFTLEAANALVPRLNLIVGEQLLRRTEIETRLKDLALRIGKTPDSLTIEPGDGEDVCEMKNELIARVATYERGWSALEEIGAVLKDPKTGLVDLYGRVEGKLVWLCWKYGETDIRHYHGLDEGFSGRKEIAAGTRARMLN
jgi:hypothetical protein